MLRDLTLGGALLAAAGTALAQVPTEDQLAAGKRVFLEQAVPTCATCHTLQDAGATGAIGPDLDDFQPTRDQLAAALRDGVGIMPSFADKLSEEQVEALISYVVHATAP